MVAFQPVVEPDLPGAFLTKHPRDILKETPQNIPLLTGITHDEGLIKSAGKRSSQMATVLVTHFLHISITFMNIVAYMNDSQLFDKFIDNLDYALPIIFYYDHHDLGVQKSITDKIKTLYFNGNLTRNMGTNVTNVRIFMKMV